MKASLVILIIWFHTELNRLGFVILKTLLQIICA